MFQNTSRSPIWWAPIQYLPHYEQHGKWDSNALFTIPTKACLSQCNKNKAKYYHDSSLMKPFYNVSGYFLRIIITLQPYMIQDIYNIITWTYLYANIVSDNCSKVLHYTLKKNNKFWYEIIYNKLNNGRIWEIIFIPTRSICICHCFQIDTDLQFTLDPALS